MYVLLFTTIFQPSTQPCGRVNACTCTTAVLNDLQPCQECLTQEQQFEEQESIINDTGDFPVSTEVPNFPSLMTPGGRTFCNFNTSCQLKPYWLKEFMEACSGAGFPIEDGSSSSATPAENSPSESSPSSISNPSTEPNGKLASNQSQISGGNVNISDQTWLFLSLCFLGIIMVS